MSLLTNEQKKEICILARRAWNILPQSVHNKYIAEFDSATAAFNAWRHDEQIKAVGTDSLVGSTNDEFCALMAHFALAAKDNYRASKWIWRFASDARRRVYWLIKQNCNAELRWPSYPDSVCRAQFKCRLWQATSKQLFNILSTIRNRASSRAAAKKDSERQLTIWK